MQSVEVDIFGRKFRLRSDDPQRICDVVNEINRQLNELQSSYDQLDFSKLLLLLALQQQEKVFTLQQKNQELASDLERLNQMIGKIIGEV